MALGLKSLEVEAGDRVALPDVQPNRMGGRTLAVTRLGAVLVPLNTRPRSVDIAHMLQDLGSVALITQHRAESFGLYRYCTGGFIEDVCPNLQHIVVAAPEEALENPSSLGLMLTRRVRRAAAGLSRQRMSMPWPISFTPPAPPDVCASHAAPPQSQ